MNNNRLKQTSREYKMNDGYVFINDVGHKALEMISRFDIDKFDRVDTYGNIDSSTNPSAASLGFTANGLNRFFEKKLRGAIYDESKALLNIQDSDMVPARNFFSFGAGLTDLSFTFHFAPAVANNIVEKLLQQGYISKPERDSLTLADYADIIKTDWFKNLMHDLAMTDNGVYGGFGEFGGDYLPDAFDRKLANSDLLRLGEPLYDLAVDYDDQKMRNRYWVRASKQLKRGLGEKLRYSSRKSSGCPAARKAVALTVAIANDRHTLSLVNDSYLRVGETASSGKIRFHQDYTPIDHSLDVLARLMERYQSEHGVPDLTDGRDRWRMPHLQKEKTRIFE